MHREGDVLEENSRSLFSFLKFISLLGLTVHHLRSIWKNKDDLEISSTSSATQKMFVSQYLYICKCTIFFHIATNNNVYILCIYIVITRQGLNICMFSLCTLFFLLFFLLWEIERFCYNSIAIIRYEGIVMHI